MEAKIWDEEVTNKYDIPMFVRFGYTYVALVETKVVGAIVAYMTNKKQIYVCDLVVDEKYRGKKIGEKLYKKLLQKIKGTTIVSFVHPTNVASINLHKKLGPTLSLMDNVWGLNEGKTYFVTIKNSES